jgi:hypothetical protein
MRKVWIALAAVVFAGPASADTLTFRLIFGGSDIGEVSHDISGTTETLSSNVSGSPLGVMDGTFVGTSRAKAGQVSYDSEGKSPAEQRLISTRTSDAQALETRITPASEATDLSDPKSVPPGTVDPVRGFGRLIRGQGCPDPFTIYDGRRVVQVTTVAAKQQDATLTCDIAYKVIAGPGHVSPFRFRNVKMRLVFAASGQGGLQEMDLKAGPFSAQLIR